MTDRDALCFDMYGTLCDTSSVTAALREELGITAAFADEVDALWRRKQLRYSLQLALMGDYRPFGEATAEALDYALAFYDLDPDEEARRAVLDAYDRLDPFDDALDALDALGAEYDLAVLSNGDPAMLESLAGNAGIDERIDAIVSADEVGTFKPAPAVYENAADRLDRSLADCALVSSNAWDVAGASAAGMGTAWVNRDGEPPERVGGEADVEVASLSALADAL